MANTIRVNLESVSKTVQELKKEAEDCLEQSNDARRLIENLSIAWQGDSYVEMSEKLTEWADEQKAQADRLNHVADAMQRTAEKIEETDRQLAKENAFGAGGGGGFR